MKRAWIGGLMAALLVLLPVRSAAGLGENYIARPFRQYYQQHEWAPLGTPVWVHN